MRFFICFLISVIIFSTTLLFAKGPPPGTGIGDVKANIMIMLDNSGSMSRTDPVSGLDRNTVDLGVANNGDIFAVDYNRDRVTRLDASYGVKGQIGGFNSRNNDTNFNVKFRDPYGIALDQNDPSDQYFYVANRSHQNGRNGFTGSYISKVCTGITVTAICPEMGRLVAVADPGQNMTGIAVQGTYLYAMGSGRVLFKYNKSNLSFVTNRNIGAEIGQFDSSRSDIAAVGSYVIVSNYNNSIVCRFNASDLSNANFLNGGNCIGLGFRPRAMAVTGKTTVSTSDDNIFIWRDNSSGSIKKYSVDTGIEIAVTNIRRGTSAGRIRSSYAIDVDSSGNLYAAERGSSNRQYVSKFNSSLSYDSRGPGGGPSQNRMQIAHAAIRAILQDPDLIAGANFGLFGWGSPWSFVLRTPISSAGANDILTRSLSLVTPRAGTNLGRAVQWMRTNYWHNTGTTPIDVGAPCQGNFNLIISDGQYFGWPTPETEMPILTNHPTMSVRSFIVGLGNNISGSNSFINLANQQYGDTTPPGALFANNVQGLTLQLRSAILAAINGNLSFTSPKVDFSSSPNGYICQPSFKYKQEDQWQGLLTRHEIKSDGSIDDPLGLDPQKTIRFHDILDSRSASVTAPNGRKVWTVDDNIENPLSGTFKNNNFDPDYLTPTNVSMLEASTKGLMLDGSNHLSSRDVLRIMKFMRGHDMFDQDSDCSASIDAINFTDICYTEDKGGADAPDLYKLHDFYNSTPAYIGKPSAFASPDVVDTENEYRSINNYDVFKSSKNNRKNVLLIGSNGGMLHAFDNGCNVANATCPNVSNPGSELWAFVPPPIVKNFQNIVTPQTYTKLATSVLGSDNVINVVNTITFPTSGVLRINDEYIKYNGKTGTSFTGLTRGYDCISNDPLCNDATSHINDTIVYNETTLRKPEYSVFGIDGPIVAKDIFTNGAWKTIAMVGFGKGGRGYTALDVTDPDNPIHMFTIFNDIRGPGLDRNVKVWQTTQNQLMPNIYETVLSEYNYTMLTETTSVNTLVSATEIQSLPVNNASAFRSSGYITVSNPDGTQEIIHYASKNGNDLETLQRGSDANGSTTAMALEAGAIVTQDSHCSLSTTNVPPEYDYTRLALTTSMPHIINIKINGVKKWVAVFGGGHNYGMDCTTGNVVYVMDLEDNPGTIIKQIAIPDDPSNAIYNTVHTNLSIVQRDGTIKADYYGALVYFADLENKLWKIDLTDNAIGSNLGRKIKLFEDVATDTNGRRNYQEIVPVLDSSVDVPIAVGQLESNILRLYYGTGDMDNLADRSSQILNRLYGISDMTFTNFALPWQSADDETNLPELYSISDCTNSTSLAATCPVLSNINQKNIGWYIDLPLSRKTTGRKVLYDNEQVYFVLYEPTNVLCNPGDAILGTYEYMCPNNKRLVIALGAGLGTGATTQGSQIYVGLSNSKVQGIHQRGDILEQGGSGFGSGLSAATIAQQIQGNAKGNDSIIVLSPVGTTSMGESSLDAWRHYSGGNYYDN